MLYILLMLVLASPFALSNESLEKFKQTLQQKSFSEGDFRQHEEIFLSLRKEKPDVALEMLHSSLEIAKGHGLKKDKEFLHNKIGNIYFDKSLFALALDNYKESVNINLELEELGAVSFGYCDIAYVYLNLGNIDLATNYYLKSIDFGLKNLEGDDTDYYPMINAYLNTSHCYSSRDMQDSTFFYLNEALLYCNGSGNYYWEWKINLHLGNYFSENKISLDSALHYYQYSKKMVKGDPAAKEKNAQIFEKIARTYQIYQINDSATVYYEKAIKIFDSIGDGIKLVYTLNSYSKFLLKEKSFQEAEEISTKAYKLSEERSYTGLKLEALFIKIKLLEAKGKHKDAYNLLLQYSRLKDSLSSKSLRVKDLQISSDLSNMSNLIENKHLKHKNTIFQYITSSVIIFSVIAFFMFYRQSETKRLANIELTKANELTVKANAELEKIGKEKDLFLNILSHDLRNPIHSQRQLFELMYREAEHCSQEELREIIADLLKSSSAVSTLLENLLSWSLANRNQLPFKPQRINLFASAGENSQLLTSFLVNKKIEIKNEISSDIEVFADADMLSSILRNILSNAMKFTPPGGTILLKANPSDEKKVLISVKDNGIGISPKNLKKLFNISEVQSTPGINDERGNGLGLLLVKQFAGSHGGSVWIESELGHGTAVFFEMPLWADTS